MRPTSHIWRACLLVLLTTVPLAASSITPETGIYWNPTTPGWAIYVEAQRDTIFTVVYAYSNTDGRPEFYVASGPIVDDIPSDLEPRVGLQPIQGFGSPLYRVPSGPCLACVYAPIPPAEEIGTMQMYFLSRGVLYARIFFSDGRRFPNPDSSLGFPMERFNYALPGLTIPGTSFTQAADLRGEWVFTDQADRGRAAWRFDFTTREDDVSLSTFAIADSIVYRDASRNAVLYCFTPDISGLTPAQRNALPAPGCEVRQNDRHARREAGAVRRHFPWAEPRCGPPAQ
jgi:hypothetical protein